MGCCFSSITTNSSTHFPTAKVIAFDGSLKEYSVPVTVSKVLGIDHLTCFLCNSDSLQFDAYIPALHSGDSLEQDQIYFILPKAKLDSPLTSTDMALLAVKASSALAVSSEKNSRRQRRWISVAPVEGTGIPLRPRSVQKKEGMNASAWVRAVRRSFNRTLSTIEEVAD